MQTEKQNEVRKRDWTCFLIANEHWHKSVGLLGCTVWGTGLVHLISSPQIFLGGLNELLPKGHGIS